ncbi:MAG TPA: branched-chain amino acid ABC transporter permease [Shinella sp.]|jgi:branched-chain amino acid transport system permease protein|uniref:branched-chain amino acid ABC transporter permease n=1 Tax=Shinella sp. TaxID=1870904 RepID=UPI0029B29B94|nr:branched-chain amino acid ABC transporter permease [Shinella sp.]MDX3975519.1 branched-chain amino acid ABC transporter permease [Shinella sp.]HEV7247537.1 branched-chain amino acid ABC transporter permease [Shinella sp.]
MTMDWNNRAAALGAGGGALLAILLFPVIFNEYEILQMTIYVILAILALSLAFIWGFGGILSFGHAMFFGLGAYSYAIASINLGETTSALLLAIVVPCLFAAALGYLMFYGRVSDVYLGAITLTVSLIFFKVANSTSGPAYKIGKAPLGGFNGIPSVPRLTVPGFTAPELDTIGLFTLCIVVLAATYVGLRYLVSSDFGRIVVSVRENERRSELLGYDVRRYKLVTFIIGAGIAGLAGCLYANWGNYTDPTVFALSQSVQIIIWIVVGGVGTFIGPILGCFFIQWLTTWLTTVDTINKDVILGAILTLMVLLLPQGFVPTLQQLARTIQARTIRQQEKAA